uniref:Uncharacterized protein n=1 Tax=Aegilops tauschii subsp. strangulata TaxID=200361 RepID=A0A453HBZ4_AEGTS
LRPLLRSHLLPLGRWSPVVGDETTVVRRLRARSRPRLWTHRTRERIPLPEVSRGVSACVRARRRRACLRVARASASLSWGNLG